MQVPALTPVTLKLVGQAVEPAVHTLLAGLTVHTAVLVLRVKVTPPVLAALRLTAIAVLPWLAYRLLGRPPMVKVAGNDNTDTVQPAEQSSEGKDW